MAIDLIGTINLAQFLGCQPIALVNPSQSGSVATAFETILQRLGWKRGWQIMRRAAANTNQIVAAGSTIPTTVGNGESWSGIAIKIYGDSGP